MRRAVTVASVGELSLNSPGGNCHDDRRHRIELCCRHPLFFGDAKV